MTKHTLLASWVHNSLKSISNNNNVTKLNVNVDILYQYLDIPWRLIMNLNGLYENFTVSINVDISKP